MSDNPVPNIPYFTPVPSTGAKSTCEICGEPYEYASQHRTMVYSCPNAEKRVEELEQQLADERLNFEKANEIIGKYEQQNTQLREACETVLIRIRCLEGASDKHYDWNADPLNLTLLTGLHEKLKSAIEEAK